MFCYLKIFVRMYNMNVIRDTSRLSKIIKRQIKRRFQKQNIIRVFISVLDMDIDFLVIDDLRDSENCKYLSDLLELSDS